MLHFLAKLGKKSWAKAIAPGCVVSVSGAYLMFHMFGHKKARNFLVARDTNGLNLELTDHVKELIVETYNDIGDQLYKDILVIPGFAPAKSPIKWFASSTMEPVTLGMTDAKTGVLIGLPFFFNYTKTMDIPDSLIRFKKMRFFKKIFKDPEGDKINQDIDRTKVNLSKDLIPPWENAIDRNDPIVKAYLDSMILSDRAIKYAVARELFIGDTYKPLLRTISMIVSGYLALILGRWAVHKGQLKTLHISRRLGVYGCAFMIGLFKYRILTTVIDRGYTNKTDNLAIASGEEYRLGAIEYLEKLQIRNQSLHKLFEDAREVFQANGDRISRFNTWKYTPIEERLSWARGPETGPEEPANNK